MKLLHLNGLKTTFPILYKPLLPLASCWRSSSEVEVQEEEPHFRLTVLGMLQLSKYLRGGRGSVSEEAWSSRMSGSESAHLMMLSRQLICW